MKTLSVYDPALCCSTGVCGTSVDPALAKFAADLDWLKKQGVTVSRYNLSQQAGAFVDNATVREILQKEGETALPVVMIDGEIKSSSTYPDREKLAEWLALKIDKVAQKSSSGSCCGPNTGCC
jgi:hypothetical protein